jgi:hypothetical protein
MCTRFWWESAKESVYSEDQDLVGKMELEWILERLAAGLWSGFSWLRIGAGCGLCECFDESLDSGTTEIVS